MKVFISSTYDDLKEHRKSAHDALAKLGLHVIWMEAFGARPVESTKVCLKEIDECELFVGIYAHRYGYIPHGSKVSITEQEFLHAEAKGKPIFGFVVDKTHAWPPVFIEFEKKAELDALLAKVKIQPVEFFTTPDSLAKCVASSVGHHLANHNGSSASGNTCPLPKPTGNSLPREGFFVGREEERKTIAAALSPESRTWGALIDGPGGIGKTALAIKAAHEAPEGLFERKIFISAKVRELTTDGEKPLTDFTQSTYLDMLEELGRELGEANLERLAPNERPNLLRLALVGKKALIVFDNLEILPEEERTRLFQFLSYLPEGNKAIATSRRRTDVDARIIRLDHLSRDESMELIAELAKKYPKLARASENERVDLYGTTQGNPLLIRWITRQLGRVGSQCRTIADACAFIEKSPKGNDPLEYIFGDLLETFSHHETLVLAALTYFTKPAKVKWLAQMSDLSECAAETALEDLTDRSILISNLEDSTYYLPPLAAQFIKTRRPEAVNLTGDELVNRVYALVMECDGNDKDFCTLDAEWDFLYAALPKLLMGDNARLQMICTKLQVFLEYTGRWDEEIWLAGRAEMRALAANDVERAGWRAYMAGKIYYFRNQLGEVLECAARASEHWRESTQRNKAFAYRLRGLGFSLSKEFSDAMTFFSKVLGIWKSISTESDDVAIALNDLASVKHATKDYDAAEHDYREALCIAKKVFFNEDIASITGNLARLNLDRERWLEAETLAREALGLADKIKRQDLIAMDCYCIAKALLQQNKNLGEALTFARRAVEIFSCLRHIKLSETQAIRIEIDKSMSNKWEFSNDL